RLAKKIFELAKEIGVDSKVILAKVWDEGISKDVVKGHMSAVGPGLEASIRDWFSGQAENAPHTAVETASKVDLDKIKAKPARRKFGKRPGEEDHGGEESTTSTVVADHPGAAESGDRAHDSQPSESSDSTGATSASHTPSPQGHIESSAVATPAPEASTAEAPAAHAAEAAVDPVAQQPATQDASVSAPASTQATPGQSTPAAEAPAAPDPAPRPAPYQLPNRPARFLRQIEAPKPSQPSTANPPAQQSPQPPMRATPHATPPARQPEAPRPGMRPSPSGPGTTGQQQPPRQDGTGQSTGAPAASGPSGAPGTASGPGSSAGPGPTSDSGTSTGPAPLRTSTLGRGPVSPQNVPTRPTIVSPAGPKLEHRTPVALRGPKVVRIEAPEQIEAPRARRPMGPGGPGGSGGSSMPTARGPRTGGGAGAPTEGGTEDDRGRSPRRKTTPAPTPQTKRSSGQGVPQRRRATSGEEWVGGPGFTEQDLLEREERLAKAGGFLKKRKNDLKKPGQAVGPGDPAASGRIRISAPFTIKDLSETTGVKASDIVKKLFLQGVMKKINDPIEVEKAVEIMMDFDVDLEVVEAKSAEEVVSSEFAERRETKALGPRGPVVTILGHVDHGKTSLLDKIRNANVAAGEAGGITQKTSAFVADLSVEGVKKQVVFLDTPGHEAFTSMRSRGARLTDIVVLVVSAPEGVMPQTIESIAHAKAAKVPIVVALNKIDRPDATEAMVQKSLGLLAEHGLNPTEWGGDTEVVRTSATTGQGIQQLLETLDYQAQLLDLKADFGGPAIGTVIEAKTEEGRGAVANLLVQQGKLKVGDFVVMGRAFGRVRDITDDRGRRIRDTSPPMPVQISGMDEVCDAGDKFYVVDSLRKAQDAAEQRRSRERQAALATPKLTLDSLFSQIQSSESDAKEIKIVLKTDQQGTVDVLKAECEKVKTSEVRVRVLHAAVGGITESDVLLSDASRAIIIGFNVIPSGKARQLAESKGVEIRTYQVIYDITDDLKKAAEGLLSPEIREDVLGHADVRAVFRISKVGSVAGCYVTDGTVQRDALIRVTRNGVVIEHDRRLAQLKRVKDDAKEVRAGMECGMKIDGYDDIKEGDVLECYRKVEVKRTL
ncbi:MAG: translation initiation factor IF-2, partial [Phycisphaerales bacterium]